MASLLFLETLLLLWVCGGRGVGFPSFMCDASVYLSEHVRFTVNHYTCTVWCLPIVHNVSMASIELHSGNVKGGSHVAHCVGPCVWCQGRHTKTSRCSTARFCSCGTRRMTLTTLPRSTSRRWKHRFLPTRMANSVGPRTTLPGTRAHSTLLVSY